MSVSPHSAIEFFRHSQRPILRWFLPALIGGLIATALILDAVWARSLSLKWAAPYLNGEAPPLLTILAAAVLAGMLLTATVIHRWFPPQEFALIALLFIPTQLVGFSYANIEPLKICLLITSGILLTSSLVNNRTIRLYPPFLMIWLLILIFSLLSIVNGQVTSLVSQYSIVAKFLMFFVVANVIRTPDQLLYAVRLLVALGVISAVAALAQEALYYFFKIPLSLDSNASKYWFKETPLGWMIRATGFHPTAQNLSHYLVIALALLMLGPFSKAARLMGGTVMALGVFFTFSGNALVVLAFIVFLVPIVQRPRFSLHYLSAVLLVFLLLYQSGLLEIIYQKYLLPISGKSAEDRVELLQTGLDVVARHPLVGIGLNNFGRLSPQPVHNAYMQLVTEIGVIPGALLLAIMLLIFVRMLIGLGRLPDGELKQSGKGILLAFIGLMFHFMFEPFINSLVSWSIIGLAEATALLLYTRPTVDPLHDRGNVTLTRERT